MFKFLLKVWGLARPYRGRLMLGVLAGVVAGLMEPLMVATIGFVYGIIFPSAGAPALAERLKSAPEFVQAWGLAAEQAMNSSVKAHPGALVALVASIPLVILLRGVFSYLTIYFLQWSAIRAITDLRMRLFEHLMRLSAGFFSRSNTGELMSRVMSDTAALQNILSFATAIMIKDPVILVSLLCWLLWCYTKITLISMIVLPLCMVPIVIYNRKVRRSSRALQTHTAELGTVMSESFTGNRVIKSYNLEDTVVEQFRVTARRFIGHYMRIIRSAEIPGPMLEFVGAIGVSLVLLYLMSQGGSRTNPEGLLIVVLGIFSMYRPLKNLTRLYNNIEQARAASERVFELLATQNSISEPAQPRPLRAAGAEIRFENVEFAYGEKPVLHDFCLEVRPGQLVALVGPSGSGKTTVSNLLLRFYDPQRGAVRIGGVDLREFATRDLRNQIALVTQETVLFNDTIYNNIALGRPGATRAEIEAAAKYAYALEFILEKPQGYDTVIGEKGVALSGGQRQRLAIARAILRNAPILVLDEATSALDTESERAVQSALDQLMQGRTTLCIAHRLSTIQKADLIVVMDQGRIVETGTHAQLLERDGVYRRLYELQFDSPTA